MQHFNSSNSSLITQVSPGEMAASVVLGLCFFVGVPGNIAVMVQLSGWLKGNSFTPRLMLSLAVSDLLTLLSLPLWIGYILKGWVCNQFLCKLVSYVVYQGSYCSTLCVVLLSVQRYIQVLHTQTWNKLETRGQKILVIGMWLLSGILASYSLVVRCAKEQHCQPCYKNHNEAVATLLWEILMFTLSLIVLVYFYFRLYQGVNRSTFFRSHTMTKVVRRIVVTYIICWVPYIIMNIMLFVVLLIGNDNLFTFTRKLSLITGPLFCINSCVNPFLYVFSARALRQQPPEAEKP